MWNWDWDTWQAEIDRMALNGINLVLAYTGREYVYRKVYHALGVNSSSIKMGHGGVEAGPAYLAFSRLENYGAYDHTTPNGGRTGGPLPDSW
jgi:alpha-N-acetylglucosaminidase